MSKLKELQQKYIDRLNTMKENQKNETDFLSDSDNELYSTRIRDVAEFISDLKNLEPKKRVFRSPPKNDFMEIFQVIKK